MADQSVELSRVLLDSAAFLQALEVFRLIIHASLGEARLVLAGGLSEAWLWHLLE